MLSRPRGFGSRKEPDVDSSSSSSSEDERDARPSTARSKLERAKTLLLKHDDEPTTVSTLPTPADIALMTRDPALRFILPNLQHPKPDDVTNPKWGTIYAEYVRWKRAQVQTQSRAPSVYSLKQPQLPSEQTPRQLGDSVRDAYRALASPAASSSSGATKRVFLVYRVGAFRAEEVENAPTTFALEVLKKILGEAGDIDVIVLPDHKTALVVSKDQEKHAVNRVASKAFNRELRGVVVHCRASMLP